MAEVRCPMCGKPNPAELEECQFCGARLKPLVAPPSQEESPPSGPEPDVPAEPAGEPADWLSGFREEEEADREDAAQPADFGEEEPELPRKAPPRGGIQERLARAGGIEPEPAGESAPDEGAAFDEDWSVDERAFDDEDLGEAELPDWLVSMRSGEESPVEAEAGKSPEEPEQDEKSDYVDRWSPPEEEAEVSPEASEIDVPEWMQGLEEERAESEPKAGPGELPDWLKQPAADLPEPEPGADPWSAGEEQAERPSWEEQTPDWLADLSAGPHPDDAGEAGFSASELQDEAEDLPDWLDDFAESPSEAEDYFPPQQPEEPEEEPGLPLELPEEAGEMPDWLADIAPGQQEVGGTGPFEGELELDEPEGVAPFTAGDEESPDWLGGISEEDLAGLEGGFDEVPDWLSDLKSRPIEPEAGSGMVGSPREAGEGEGEGYESELPGWFDEETEAEGLSEMEVEPGLTPATLPSWLEAMRPVEDAAPAPPIEDETEDHVESAGPLSGLRGVLPAEPEVARLRKPPTYSSRLQVTETQESQAEILRNLLKSESRSRPIPTPPLISSQHVLRWVIAAVLILAILLPLVGVGGAAPLPTFTSETAQANRIIRDLPPDSRVLIGFDYEPGLSGEMDAVADAVIDHLILRGALLTLVSSSPTGPVVAERFMSTTQADHNYTAGTQYINLGYVPGGRTGLLSFAESPQRTLPYTLRGATAWGTGADPALAPVQGIDALSDFDMLMVITDNPDTARAWIEQVQPVLVADDSQTPLVMAVSAQAEPMVRPYYHESAGQVQGLVVGLRGAAAYSNLTGRVNLPGAYWGAFGIGSAVAAAVILVASIVAIASSLIAPRQKRAPEEAA